MNDVNAVRQKKSLSSKSNEDQQCGALSGIKTNSSYAGTLLKAVGRSLRPEAAFSADTLIIGFTGSIGSGCTFVSEGLTDVLGTDAQHYLMSTPLRQTAKDRGQSERDTSVLQNLGNELREKEGNSVLAERCIATIRADIAAGKFKESEGTVILVDGIRNDGEIRCFRQFPNFYLMSIHAEKSTREKRVVGPEARHPRFNAIGEFEAADARDEHEDFPSGQQVKLCNYLADVIIYNDQTFADAHETKRNAYFNKIVAEYIRPMKAAQRGRRSHERPPSIDETLMTIAYCASKRSSCLKRKVGAVVAFVGEMEGSQTGESRKDERRWFRVLSTGYNEVPLGTTACVFGEHQQCYRDHLREAHASQFVFCPRCGKKMPDQVKCPRCGTVNRGKKLQCENRDCKEDLILSYSCECGCGVFTDLVPGGEGAPGKLLDMCRALHAEEMAIIGLSNTSVREKGDLVLYTTTFPCNQCANRIVAVGINRVVYAEAYTMKESKEILGKKPVQIQKFEGVKSTAYFRLYA